MPTKFLMTRDIAGFNGFGVTFTLDARSGILAANVEQHITVPSEYSHYIAIFSYTPGSDIWVDGIGTAVVPTGAFSATTSQLNPAARLVAAGDTLSFITDDLTGPNVSVLFYVAPPYTN